MSWIEKIKPPGFSSDEKKVGFPEGLWKKCPTCQEVMFQEDLEKNFLVCLKCKYHFRIRSRKRLEFILDAGSFQELDQNMAPLDPLEFKDIKKYKDRIKALAKDTTQEKEAFMYGPAKINGFEIVVGSFVFEYMGGSMGSVVGEKLARTFELAHEKRRPCLLITSSGGARMQEGILSLMQMAKSTAALAKLKKAGIPMIVLLTDPTTGGVAASVAMLGDLLVAEPNALIGFAGPRVIEQTIKEKLPEGFQRSEFLLEHGMLDMIIQRPVMKETLYGLFSKLGYAL